MFIDNTLARFLVEILAVAPTYTLQNPLLNLIPRRFTAIMGRELQKKKNKSSIPKKRQKAPSKKKLLQNPIIARHWYVPQHNLNIKHNIAYPISVVNHHLPGTKKKPYPKTTAA